MFRNLSDFEHPLGALESGYRRQHLRQDIRQSILVAAFGCCPIFCSSSLII